MKEVSEVLNFRAQDATSALLPRLLFRIRQPWRSSLSITRFRLQSRCQLSSKDSDLGEAQILEKSNKSVFQVYSLVLRELLNLLNLASDLPSLAGGLPMFKNANLLCLTSAKQHQFSTSDFATLDLLIIWMLGCLSSALL